MFAMRRGAALALGAVVLLSGCSGDPDPSASPEQQVEADSPPANAEEARQVLVDAGLCSNPSEPGKDSGFLTQDFPGSVDGSDVCRDEKDSLLAIFIDLPSLADRDKVAEYANGDAWVPNSDALWAVQFYDTDGGHRAAQVFGDSVKQVRGTPASS